MCARACARTCATIVCLFNYGWKLGLLLHCSCCENFLAAFIFLSFYKKNGSSHIFYVETRIDVCTGTWFSASGEVFLDISFLAGCWWAASWDCKAHGLGQAHVEQSAGRRLPSFGSVRILWDNNKLVPQNFHKLVLLPQMHSSPLFIELGPSYPCITV